MTSFVDVSKSSTTSVEIQGFALRVIRERSGQKMAEVAEALNVDRSYINKIETGHSKRVSTVFYSRLLAQLNLADYRALLANPADSDLTAGAA